MSNILIIENDKGDFEFIYKALLKLEVFQYSEIYPTYRSKRNQNIEIHSMNLDNYSTEFEFLQMVYKRINDSNYSSIFKKILNAYPNIEYYIIDKALILKSDEYGIHFYNYLIENGIQKEKIFVVTNTRKESLSIEIDNEFYEIKNHSGVYGMNIARKIKKLKDGK